MKRRLCVLIVSSIFLMLLLISCEVSRKNNQSSNLALQVGVATPLRIGKSPMKVEFVKRYTLKQAMEEADVVAIVEITSWLSEENYSYHTYFKTKMINQLINKIDNNLEDFTLVQHGSSKATLASYPLFQKGDQLLLCLKKNKDGVFYIVGDLHTAMQYRSNENQEYLLPFVALIDEFSESLVASLNSYVPDLGVIEQQLNKELLAYAPKEFFQGGDYKPLNKRQPHYADKLLEQIQKQYP